MIWYEVLEGKHGNDYEQLEKEFIKESSALKYANQSKYPYVRIDKFQGSYSKLGGYDGDYVDSIYEKGGLI